MIACSLPNSLPHLNVMCDKTYSALRGPPLIFASGDPAANISWTKQIMNHQMHIYEKISYKKKTFSPFAIFYEKVNKTKNNEYLLANC